MAIRTAGGAAVVVAGLALVGCGLSIGYAPPAITLHRSRAPQAVPAAADTLRIVSWNIKYGEDPGTALFEFRATPELAAADIILLQEMDPQGSAFLADKLGFHHVHGSASVSPHHKRLFGNAVLSRWPISNEQALILPHPTPVTGHRRIAIAADIDLGEGRTLRAVSVHTATVVVELEKRLAQFAAVADTLGGATLTVIGGDFNTVTDYEVVQLRRVMRARGLQAVPLPPGPTISNRIRRMPGSVPVLDHVFVRGAKAGARGVVPQTDASDHYPIWLDLVGF